MSASSRQEGSNIIVQPIQSAARELVELSLHYLVNQPHRICTVGQESPLPGPDSIAASPRMIAFVDAGPLMCGRCCTFAAVQRRKSPAKISIYRSYLWSYGDSNPGPLACHQQAGHPPASIAAGHRPTTSAPVPRNPGRLRYFPAVPLARPPCSRRPRTSRHATSQRSCELRRPGLGEPGTRPGTQSRQIPDPARLQCMGGAQPAPARDGRTRRGRPGSLVRRRLS
jgi:hypothetical protein